MCCASRNLNEAGRIINTNQRIFQVWLIDFPGPGKKTAARNKKILLAVENSPVSHVASTTDT